MNLKKDSNKYIFDVWPAYHRGGWVDVPLFFIPRNALGKDGNLHSFQLVLLDEKQSLQTRPARSCEKAYKHIENQVKKTVLPWMLSEEEIHELCTRNDIPISWVTGRQREILLFKTTDRSSRRKARKYTALKQSEYKKFIKQLKKMTTQIALIAEILWYLNGQLQAGDDYITLEEVLRMKIDDVDPEDGLTTCIRLIRSAPHGSHMVSHWMPEYIWKSLCSLIKDDVLYVFSNRKRGPLLPSDVARSFEKAGKLAGIEGSVGSLSLRSIGTTKKNGKAQNIFNSGVLYQDISEEEWKILLNQFPTIVKRVGKPSQYDRRNILNGILYLLNNNIPINKNSKLPVSYPPASAIDSQYRRWLKNGMLESIMSARK